MTRIDLDAAKAARREALGESPIVVFAEKEYTLPIELPFEVAEALGQLTDATDGAQAASVMEKIFRILLGDGYDGFIQDHPTLNDMNALMEAVGGLYGVAGSESTASAESS